MRAATSARLPDSADDNKHKRPLNSVSPRSPSPSIIGRPPDIRRTSRKQDVSPRRILLADDGIGQLGAGAEFYCHENAGLCRKLGQHFLDALRSCTFVRVDHDVPGRRFFAAGNVSPQATSNATDTSAVSALMPPQRPRNRDRPT
jgi:hypothetical protein